MVYLALKSLIVFPFLVFLVMLLIFGKKKALYISGPFFFLSIVNLTTYLFNIFICIFILMLYIALSILFATKRKGMLGKIKKVSTKFTQFGFLLYIILIIIGIVKEF